MITLAQALTLDTFHAPRTKQPINGQGKCDIYRRNGKTQVWKTRPNNFRVPVKYGIYTFGQITHFDTHLFYPPNECPACLGTKR